MSRDRFPNTLKVFWNFVNCMYWHLLYDSMGNKSVYSVFWVVYDKNLLLDTYGSLILDCISTLVLGLSGYTIQETFHKSNNIQTADLFPGKCICQKKNHQLQKYSSNGDKVRMDHLICEWSCQSFVVFANGYKFHRSADEPHIRCCDLAKDLQDNVCS